MGTRSRTRGGFTNIVGSGFWKNLSNGGHAENYYNGSVGAIETISDTVTPNFAKLKAAGTIINNPCTIFRNEIQQTGINCTWSTTNWTEGWINLPIQVVAPKPSPAFLDDSLALAAAVNKANANVAPADAMVPVTVAEIGKTVDTFKNLGRTCAQFANSIRFSLGSLRGRKTSRREQERTLRELSQAWLAFRYGIMPTIYDLQGCVKAVNRKYEIRETARGQSEITDTYTVPIYIGWRGPITGVWTVERKTSYRAGVLYSPSSEPDVRLATNLGISAADALTVPWELVPFSFVLDWAIDVGDWLRAVTPKPGVQMLASWTTKIQEVKVSTSGVTASVTEPNWTGGGGGGAYVETVYLKTRVPSATPSIPGYGAGLNLKRSIDAAMLGINSVISAANQLEKAVSDAKARR